MPATPSPIVRPAETKSPGASLRILDACRKGIARRFVRSAAIARLRELDGHALRDIGLLRSRIEGVVDGLITAPNRARAR